MHYNPVISFNPVINKLMTDAPTLNYIYAVGLYTYDNVQDPIIKRGIWISLSSTSINLL